MKELNVSMERVIDQLVVSYQFDKENYKAILSFAHCLFAAHEDEFNQLLTEKAKAKGLIK